ncbi:uncharacterized protein TRAVEDRAFT_22290 [Trametes versicolor FP-101664 SS1]|uniref:uncharacterized protein n=1 Tax=Trametes versicolor (strain FP-101664) TaxID=717944 RepID=UPI0004622182|nr:uncharacterized protein TRAVEDRAFT_22290 [Trametes versicolor FP-101664 SS1]EIW55879.1 hypothetical protein TRAVEDRAFT_22290 [Trametes versicolor FP-101664 SS1]
MSTEPLATMAEHLLAAKMFSLASCVMLFYDIAITFGDEVEKIWKQRFTGATVLWFMNRYLSPLGYIVIIVSFHDPSWSKATCQRYVLYPEALKIVTSTAIGLIFILRLYSIYSKRNLILYVFGTLLVTELAVKIWAFTDGTMLVLPPDSVVFFATLYRTIQLYRRTVIGEAQSLITIIMRDGIMYFAAIFVSNLVTVLIFIFATPDLKVINASFSTLITSLMVSRLMLNLRKEVLRRGPVMSSHGGRGYGNGRTGYEESYQLTAAHEMSAAKTFQSSIIGNLGAPIITFERTGYEDEYGLYDEDDERSDHHGHQMSDMRNSDGDEEGRGDLAKKPSLTTSLTGGSGPLPKVFGGKRRPRTPGDPPEHTRSLPGQLVVQMTEEVVVVTEAADPTHTPLPPPPRASRFQSQRSPPASPSPRTPTTPRTPQTPPASSPHTPRTSESAYSQSQSLSAPRSAYPSRPPQSAGAVYPPASPHAPDSPLNQGYDARPLKASRSAQATTTATTTRRSWAAPPSWKLSLDRERERKGTS